MNVIYFKLHIFKHLNERCVQRHIVCFGPPIWSQPAVCGISSWLMNNLPRSWSLFIYFVWAETCVCLCWRKAAWCCSRDITSFHNKKCWGVCVVQSAAQERRCAVRGTLLKAEMLQRERERDEGGEKNPAWAICLKPELFLITDCRGRHGDKNWIPNGLSLRTKKIGPCVTGLMWQW